MIRFLAGGRKKGTDGGVIGKLTDLIEQFKEAVPLWYVLVVFASCITLGLLLIFWLQLGWSVVSISLTIVSSGILAYPVAFSSVKIYLGFVEHVRMERARKSRKSDDCKGVFKSATSVLKVTACNFQKRGTTEEALGLLDWVYEFCSLQSAAKDEIRSIHQEYCTLHTTHADLNGRVPDKVISSMMRRLAERCRSLVRSLPTPDCC